MLLYFYSRCFEEGVQICGPESDSQTGDQSVPAP